MAERLVHQSGVIARRDIFRLGAVGLGAVAGAGTLAGCGSDSTDSAESSDTSLPEVGGPMRYFTYEGYDGKGVIDDWFEQKNIQPDVKFISNENIGQFIASPSGEDFDVYSSNQGVVPYYASLGIVRPISTQEVPAISDFYPIFRDSDLWKNADGTYNAIPWGWGPIGITYNPEKVDAEEIQSWQDLLSPRFANRMGMFDDALNAVAVGAMATGLDPGAVTVDQLNGPIKDYLTELRSQLKVLSTTIGDQVNTLVAGDVDVQVVGYLFLNSQGEAAGVPLAFTYPLEEGTYGFADSLTIPPNAPNPQNALAFIDMMVSENEWSTTMQNYNLQLSSNPGVNATLDESLLSQYPEDLEEFLGEKLKFNRSYFEESSGFATVDDGDRLWQEVKAGT
jgi:spermidine/putrescine transport system substrate-binding protein